MTLLFHYSSNWILENSNDVFLKGSTPSSYLKTTKFYENMEVKEYIKYSKTMKQGDYNMEVSEPCLSQFLENYSVTSIVKGKM